MSPNDAQTIVDPFKQATAINDPFKSSSEPLYGPLPALPVESKPQAGLVKDTGRGLVSGSASLVGGLYGAVPATARILYNLGSLPQNLAGQVPGLGFLQTDYARMMEETGSRTPAGKVLEGLEALGEESMDIAKGVSPMGTTRRDLGESTMLDKLKAGKLKEFGEHLYYALVENTPQYVGVFGLAAMGRPDLAGKMLATSAGGGQYLDIKDHPEMGTYAKDLNIVGTGASEYIFEHTMGADAILKRFFGDEAKAATIKMGIKQAAKESSKSFGLNATEEWATEVTNNVTDRITGNTREDGSLPGPFDNTFESLMVGGFMGLGMSAVGTASMNRRITINDAEAFKAAMNNPLGVMSFAVAHPAIAQDLAESTDSSRRALGKFFPGVKLNAKERTDIILNVRAAWESGWPQQMGRKLESPPGNLGPMQGPLPALPSEVAPPTQVVDTTTPVVAPPEVAPDVAPPAVEADIPAHVQKSIQGFVGRAQSFKSTIDEVRAMGERYLWEWAKGTEGQAAIDAQAEWEKTLASFAEENRPKAEAYAASIGGVPDIRALVEAARKWGDAPIKPPAPPPPAPKPDDAPTGVEVTDDSGAIYVVEGVRPDGTEKKKWVQTKSGLREGRRYDPGFAEKVLTFDDDIGDRAPLGNSTDVDYVKSIFGPSEIIVGRRRATADELLKQRKRFEEDLAEGGAALVDANIAKDLGYVLEGGTYVFKGETPAPPPVAPPPAPKPDEAPTFDTYEDFAKAYRTAFKEMNKYTPDQPGSLVFAERMAAMADKYPDWAERAENEVETPPTPKSDESPARRNTVHEATARAVDKIIATVDTGRPGDTWNDRWREGAIRRLSKDFLPGKQSGEFATAKIAMSKAKTVDDLKKIAAMLREKDVYQAPPAPKSDAGVTLADRVAEALDGDTAFDNSSFFAMADEAYGGSRGAGKYGPSQAYDAMELGVNKAIQKRGYSPDVSADEANQTVAALEALTDRLPPQTNRSGEKDTFQQFSTPPAYAYVANWVSGVGKGDSMAETSAGLGGIAVFAKNAGATVLVNELSENRSALLASMGFDAQRQGDGEQMHNILTDDALAKHGVARPTVVVINPPFSTSAGRMEGKKVPHADLKHLDSALKTLAPGGRLVAIIGAPLKQGQDKTVSAWLAKKGEAHAVRANVEVNRGVYKKYGTTFPTRILVIDKVAPTGGQVVTGLADSLPGLIDMLQEVRDVRSRDSKSDGTGSGVQGARQEGEVGGTPPGQPRGDANDSLPGSEQGETDGAVGKGRGDVDGSGQGGAGKADAVSSGPADGGRKRRGRKPGNSGDGADGGSEGQRDGRGGGTGEQNVVRPQVDITKLSEQQIADILNGVPLEQVLASSPAPAPAPTPSPAPAPAKKKLRKPIAEKAATARKEAAAAWDDVFDYIKGKTFAVPGADTKLWGLVVKATSKTVAAGTYSFGEMIDNMAKTFGKQKVLALGDLLQKAWDTLHAMDSSRRLSPSTSVKTLLGSAEKINYEYVSTDGITRERSGESGVFYYYVPQIRIQGAQAHPSRLIETLGLASTPLPKTDYRLTIPTRVITEGLASEAQLEFATYAGHAFSSDLPDGRRRGILNGDGTGSGKGRQFALTILDDFGKREAEAKPKPKKALWLTEKPGLLSAAKRDWKGLGGDKNDVFLLNKAAKSGKPLVRDEGIMCCTYATLGTELKEKAARKGDISRLDQIAQWLGDDFDGVIIFDEAHLMGNAMPSGGGKAAAKRAIAGVELQNRFPRAKIVYGSATSATEVSNMAYGTRLNLWGAGSPFPDLGSFVEAISTGGISAMEAVTMHLKANGQFMARSLAYNDGTVKGSVKYDTLDHDLTEDQSMMYDKLSEGWMKVMDNVMAALSAASESPTGKISGRAKGQAMSAFWFANQRFWNQVVTAMQTPATIEAIRKDLAAGKSCVIQLTNTHESTQNRKLAEWAEDSYDEFSVSPHETLMEFIRNSFPIRQYVPSTDANGNVTMIPASTTEMQPDPVTGQMVPVEVPVYNQEAIQIRDNLLADISGLEHMIPQSPLDMIIDALGAETVAEVTGRKQRIVTVEQPDGTMKKERQALSLTFRDGEAQLFNDLKKRVLIFSNAGATGSSYHASFEYANQQDRMHYLLQAGWQANVTFQGFGRTHRTNQASAPTYVMVQTNVPGQKRFITTIARRLGQMGALSTGSQKSTTEGLFAKVDNLEGQQGRDALSQFFRLIVDNNFEFSVSQFERMTGLEIWDAQHKTMKRDLPDIGHFLNRMLNLPLVSQNTLMDGFMTVYEDVMEKAIEDNQVDTGTQAYHADKLTKVEEKTVHTDEQTGAVATYVKLKAEIKNNPRSWDSLQELVGARREDFVGYVKNIHDRPFAVFHSKASHTDSRTGSVTPQLRLVDCLSPRTIDRNTLREPNYTNLTEAQAKAAWETYIEELPETTPHDVHVITGAFINLWDRIKGRPKIYRFEMEGGAIVGRVIPPMQLRDTMLSLGVEAGADKLTVEGAYQAMKEKQSVILANGWKIEPSLVGGEWRNEIKWPTFAFERVLGGMGVFVERIASKTRYFIPTGQNEMETFMNVAKAYPPIRTQNLKGAASEIMEQADAAYGMSYNASQGSLLGGLFRVPTAPPRTDEVAPDLQFLDPEVERRTTAADGIDRGSIKDKVKAFIEASYHKMSRAREHLPKEAGFHKFDEAFRLFKEYPERARDEAMRRITAIVAPLTGPNQMRVFRDMLIVNNQLAAYDRTEPFRLGFTSIDGVMAEKNRLDPLVAGTPAIEQALEYRRQIVSELVTELVRYGLLPESAIGRAESYFHQQVHSKRSEAKSSGKNAQKRKRAFQQQRVQAIEKGEVWGEWLDYNTNYLEAETTWMIEAMEELYKAKWKEQFLDPFDSMKPLKRQASDQNYVAVVGGPENMARIIEIRGQLAESRASENAGESDERQMRKALIEELDILDPTQPFRRKIARYADIIAELSEKLPKDVVDSAPKDIRAYLGDTEALLDLDENDGGYFRFINWLATGPMAEDKIGRSAMGLLGQISKRREDIRTRLGRNYQTWQRLADDAGLATWQSEEGHVLFKAMTIPEKIAEAFQLELIDEYKITPDQLQEVRAMGGPRQQMVLPAEVVAQLDEMKKPKADGMVGSGAKFMINLWKKRLLFFPDRAPIYMGRNITGDIDPYTGAGVTIDGKEIYECGKELYDAMKLQKITRSEALQVCLDLGVVGSSITMIEMDHSRTPDLKDTKAFNRFFEQDKSITTLPVRLAKQYMNWVLSINEVREGVLRYAAFKYFRNQLNTGTLTTYGASSREAVDEIQRVFGNDIAAARLARDLMVDYSNNTVFGEWMRNYVYPFWSFQEGTLKRYPHMIANAATSGARAKARGAGAVKAATITIGSLLAIGKVNAFLWFWNNILFREEEEKLSDDDKSSPHLILGKTAYGNPIVIRNVGAFGEFLEWFGVSDAMSNLQYLQENQMSFSDYMKEIGKAPVKKLVGGLGPQFKVAIEVTSGMSPYPDPFDWSSVDRGEALFNALAFREEYRAVKGMVAQDGTRVRRNYPVRKLGLGVIEYRRTALHQTHDLREKFLAMKGKEKSGRFEASPTRNMREAVIAQNFEAFTEARQHYLRRGFKADNFLRSLEYIDPITRKLNDEDEKAFDASLTPEQRSKVQVARDYASELHTSMWLWWRRADKETGEADAWKESFDHTIAQQAAKLAKPRPARKADVEAWEQERAQARQWMADKGVTTQEARAAYRTRLRKTIKTPETMAGYLSRMSAGMPPRLTPD